jgi:hypothetical protein
MKYMLLVATVLLLVSPCLAEENQDVPFHLPTPEGWKTETIPFPLNFAPEIEYEGLEELRFAPGMFKPETEDFWSYAFVWWIPQDTELTAEQLQKDLDAYYRGLNHDKPGDEKEIPPVHSVVKKVDAVDGEPARFEGTIDTFDSFVTEEPITLNFQAEVIICEKQEKMAVYFGLSPQPVTHAVWEELQKIRAGFGCSR